MASHGGQIGTKFDTKYVIATAGHRYGSLAGAAADFEHAALSRDAGERYDIVKESIRVARSSFIVELGIVIEGLA
jgi:hypothetical protein